jgi:hypothetical protein
MKTRESGPSALFAAGSGNRSAIMPVDNNGRLSFTSIFTVELTMVCDVTPVGP